MTGSLLAPEAEIHLLAIRKALANRNAAVMVGAGFSRNAEGGENLATWRQLSEALAAELEPKKPSGMFSPAGTSQLAEQYSRVFSPSHLEQLIKRCVPDDQVTPGSLHTALLKLPWSEVFTTNYDTLLERAADKLFEASYFTVYSREDIPQSKVQNRRRIVKLHGSFPSQRPFILTEEHYRTYPDKFAPFVNLVRQSLLENVVCLIGFSGDDPNFLHWLGWVRDMLDKHALPVYLFLAEEPTLGERKLYEARGVVPVVLPLGPNNDSKDYQARYRQLFEEMKRPLSDSPLDWGNFSAPEIKSGEQKDVDFSWFLNQLPALAKYRHTYPGWLIAPSKVRERFRIAADWLEMHLNSAWVRERLAILPAPLIISVIELYFWVQQIMLRPVDDNLAAICHDAVLAENACAVEGIAENQAQFLKRMSIFDTDSLRKAWVQATTTLLTWARQSHRVAQYNELRQKLQALAKKDSSAQDRLVYEEVLRYLQNADHCTALDIVTKWRPKSSDTYVQVLKASLLAESGDPSSAISLCEQAIEALRRQQRSRPDDPDLISKEAWACLVASLIQRSVNFIEIVQKAAQSTTQLENSDDSVDQPEKEDFNDRINALGVRGYSAREELNIALAELNAEAELPTAERQQTTNFELGSSSMTIRLGSQSDLRGKILASFAWLELIEHVGLLPHTRNINFYSKEMLQAAWWIRFADRPERSTGLLLRANQQDALKSHDSALPPHRTGWLNRYEVALLNEQAATELAAELLLLTMSEFDGSRPSSSTSNRMVFVIEVFGRLTIRVRDESLLLRWGQQLIELHRTEAFRENHSVWQPTCQAITRILESVSSHFQAHLLMLAFQIPLIPSTGFPEHLLEDWINLIKLSKTCSLEAQQRELIEWRPIVRDLLVKLRTPKSNEPSWLVWRRLEALRMSSLLTESERKEVGELLWGKAEPGQWPVIPNSVPALTLNWPAPKDDAIPQFLDKLLSRPLRPFGAGYMEMFPAHKRRSYHIGGADRDLSQVWFAINLRQPSLVQLADLIAWIGEWIDSEQSDLLVDINEHHEIRDSVLKIVVYLDEILALCIQQLSQVKKTSKTTRIKTQVLYLDAKLQPFHCERIKLHRALVNSGDREAATLDKQLRNIIRTMSSDDDLASNQAIRAALSFLGDASNHDQESLQPIFDATVACVYARRMPSLPRALDILVNLKQESWHRWLDSRSLLFLDIALDTLTSQLAYGATSRDPSITEELVPLLRFKTTQLAFVLVEVAGVESEAALRWLANSSTDPLPELRLGRFKFTEQC